jgi:hypothetical protein
MSGAAQRLYAQWSGGGIPAKDGTRRGSRYHGIDNDDRLAGRNGFPGFEQTRRFAALLPSVHA